MFLHKISTVRFGNKPAFTSGGNLHGRFCQYMSPHYHHIVTDILLNFGVFPDKREGLFTGGLKMSQQNMQAGQTDDIEKQGKALMTRPKIAWPTVTMFVCAFGLFGLSCYAHINGALPLYAAIALNCIAVLHGNLPWRMMPRTAPSAPIAS